MARRDKNQPPPHLILPRTEVSSKHLSRRQLLYGARSAFGALVALAALPSSADTAPTGEYDGMTDPHAGVNDMAMTQEGSGLPSAMRDAGTMVMFAGTPWAHLQICGSPWDGNEYHAGERGSANADLFQTIAGCDGLSKH
jgi:hypothetical protein